MHGNAAYKCFFGTKRFKTPKQKGGSGGAWLTRGLPVVARSARSFFFSSFLLGFPRCSLTALTSDLQSINF